MSTPFSIRLEYSIGSPTDGGTRVVDIETLQRFGGYDIGSRETNHLVLKDASISPFHARIVRDGDNSYRLIHLETGRKDSVRLNSSWLAPGASAELLGGDRFVIGGVSFMFYTSEI